MPNSLDPWERMGTVYLPIHPIHLPLKHQSNVGNCTIPMDLMGNCSKCSFQMGFHETSRASRNVIGVNRFGTYARHIASFPNGKGKIKILLKLAPIVFCSIIFMSHWLGSVTRTCATISSKFIDPRN